MANRLQEHIASESTFVLYPSSVVISSYSRTTGMNMSIEKQSNTNLPAIKKY